MTDESDGRRRLRRGTGWTPFAMTPEWLLDAPVSDRAKVLYAMLSRYADAGSRAFPGRKKLAERLSVTLPTLDKAIKELAEIGALTIEARYRDDGGQTSNTYVLHFERHVAPGSQDTDSGGEPSLLSPKELEPVGTRDARTPNGVLATRDDPPTVFDPKKLALVDGRNLGFDALAEECSIDPKSPRVGEIGTALNGHPRRPELGIRSMLYGELCDWAIRNHSTLATVPAALLAEPERFEQALARAIHEKAAKYRQRMPEGTIVTPTALAKWWLDLERMEDARGGLSVEGMLNLDA